MTAWLQVLTSELAEDRLAAVRSDGGAPPSHRARGRDGTLFDLPSIMRSSTRAAARRQRSSQMLGYASPPSEQQQSSAAALSQIARTDLVRREGAGPSRRSSSRPAFGRAGHHHDRGAWARPAQAFERQHAAAVAQHCVQHDQIDVGICLHWRRPGGANRPPAPQLRAPLTQQQRKAFAKTAIRSSTSSTVRDQTPLA